MTSAQVVETSVNVISNSPSQDYTHPDDRTLLYDMIPGFKPFTILSKYCYYKHVLAEVILSVVDVLFKRRAGLFLIYWYKGTRRIAFMEKRVSLKFIAIMLLRTLEISIREKHSELN